MTPYKEEVATKESNPLFRSVESTIDLYLITTGWESPSKKEGLFSITATHKAWVTSVSPM